MKKLVEHEIGTVVVCPGDTFTVDYDDGKGDKRTLVSHTVDKAEVFNTAAVYELEDGDLGMEAGLAGVVGRKQVES